MTDSSDQVSQLTVRCPECGHEFSTHDIGDLVACEECDEHFERFTNIVEGEVR